MLILLTTMKLLIATPLFPPDMADPAPYIKELATRLTKEHRVTVLAYGSLPESVSKVTFITIPKRFSAPWRLLRCTLQLFRAAAAHDRVLLQNGASIEMPAYMVSRWYRSKLMLMMSDQKVTYSGWRASLHKRLTARCLVLSHHELTWPPPRPEVFPFVPKPETDFLHYEQSWQEHLKHLTKHLSS